jgi:hypothetical protein
MNSIKNGIQRNRIKLLGFAMGLSLMALHADRGAAASNCQGQCQANYNQCQMVCSQNPCLVSCDTQLQDCLSGCSSN